MSTGSASGPGWLKLWDEGYDEAEGLWCTEKLIAADGLLSFRIPTTLPPGNWLFRPELLALQNVNEHDPQFYVGCAQVFVEGAPAVSDGGVAVAAGGKSVSIPGHLAADDPGLTFDIYAPKLALPYPVPGPGVFVPSGPSSSSPSTNAAKVVRLAEGGVPADFLIKNANWVGVELAPYKTEDGCWAAAEACWGQADACYDAAPPSGNENCPVWEAKCEAINNACGAGDYEGPPDRGARLESQEPAPPAGIPAPVNEGRKEGEEAAADPESAPTPPETAEGGLGEETEAEGPGVVTLTRFVTVPAAQETAS